MNWILLDPAGRFIAHGSWRGVIEAGEEEGVIQRRYSEKHGNECCPKLMPGCVFVPAPMLPQIEVETQ